MMDKEKQLQRISADRCNSLVQFYPAALQEMPADAVAIVVDDNLIQRDTVCAAGSHMLYSFRPPFQAEAITRAQAAGYTVIGRANIGEFNMAGSETSWFGPTLHPQDTAHLTSGAAAAVAQGFAEAALIVDAGGANLRQAALGGCSAFRPTYGSVSRFGIIAFLSSSEQIGGVARDIDTAAALVQAVAGHDEKDATSLPKPQYDYAAAADVAGLRIALVEDLLAAAGAPARAATEQAAEALAAAGAQISRIRLRQAALAPQALAVMAAAEGCNNISRFDGVKYGYRTANYRNIEELYCRSRGEAIGETAKCLAMLGSLVLAKDNYEPYYRKALQVRYLVKQELDQIFTSCDLLLAPVAPAEAPLAADAAASPFPFCDPAHAFGAAATLAGLPVAVLPYGTAENGLPFGLQLFADSGHDSLPLRAAKALQAAPRKGGAC